MQRQSIMTNRNSRRKKGEIRESKELSIIEGIQSELFFFRLFRASIALSGYDGTD